MIERNMPDTILIVEDEPEIRGILTRALESRGYKVREADTLTSALTQLSLFTPQLILLDLGMPDGSGIDLIDKVRTWSDVPIIVISDRVSERDKVDALHLGADDYITKPFSSQEMLARVQAIMRRASKDPDPESPIVTFGLVHVDLTKRVVRKSGEEIRLTPTEYKLLATLIKNAGKVMTQKKLLVEVWGASASDNGHYLRIYVGRLRHKLEQDPISPRHFLTEIGVGYRFQQ